ncbi:hypothetical protein DVH24_010391 [Malus domestica]|uniref:Uncharacterized protein n=1 Tax=Malus domestica TaxID=3750 RepID=A0A498JSN9_MALDO|nr:hypothetical protein DVH24_010391 [Malus domestica]
MELQCSFNEKTHYQTVFFFQKHFYKKVYQTLCCFISQPLILTAQPLILTAHNNTKPALRQVYGLAAGKPEKLDSVLHVVEN